MDSYDYENREGVRFVSWTDFAALYEQLALKIVENNIDVIIGIARGGLFPSTAISCALRTEMFPVKLSRRDNDVVVRQDPAWIVDITSKVADKRVVIIDEIADTGMTLQMAKQRAYESGASEVFSACLIAHTHADPKPDIVSEITDDLIVFPWDSRVLVDGKWQVHPEVIEFIDK